MKWCEVIGLNKGTLVTPHSPPIDEQSWILDSTDKWLCMKGCIVAPEGTQPSWIWATWVHMARGCKSVIVSGAPRKGTHVGICAKRWLQITGLRSKVSFCALLYPAECSIVGAQDSFYDLFILFWEVVCWRFAKSVVPHYSCKMRKVSEDAEQSDGNNSFKCNRTWSFPGWLGYLPPISGVWRFHLSYRLIRIWYCQRLKCVGSSPTVFWFDFTVD